MRVASYAFTSSHMELLTELDTGIGFEILSLLFSHPFASRRHVGQARINPECGLSYPLVSPTLGPPTANALVSGIPSISWMPKTRDTSRKHIRSIGSLMLSSISWAYSYLHKLSYSLTNKPAIPIPVPTHILTTPTCPPLLSKPCIIVAVILAPVAPSG